MIIVDVDEIILEYYSRFGEEANQHRAIPSGIDYLKPVQRKIIEAAYNGVNGAGRDKLVKSAAIIGDTMKAHPHGDGSIYSAMVTMVSQGLLKGKGNWGLNAGLSSEPPASFRYTECHIDLNILNIIKMTFKSTIFIEGESSKEAMYIPCPIPLGLINNGIETAIVQGVGVGVSVKTPCFRSIDLANRMIDLLNKKSTPKKMKWDNANINEVDTVVTTGKGSIITTGEYKMLNELELCITKLPIGCSGSRIRDVLNELLELKQVVIRDESSLTTRVIIKCFTRKKMEDVEKIVKKIMKSSTAFNVLVSDPESGKIKRFSIDEILTTNMLYYLKAYNSYYNEIKVDIITKMEELDVIQKMKPYLIEEMKNKIIDVDKSIKTIAEKLNSKIGVIEEIISKHSIKKLLTTNTDTNELKIKLDSIQEKLDNPKDNIIQILKQFK